MGVSSIINSPLWRTETPRWAKDGWVSFRAALPIGLDWDVWIDWYEQRLRGDTRGKAYDLVFATVPQKEWDKGPGAANAWIKASLPAAAAQETGDAFSLEVWLGTQTRETSTAIAVRAALRAAPLAARIARKGVGLQPQRELTHVTAVIFARSQQLACPYRIQSGFLFRLLAKHPGLPPHRPWSLSSLTK
jgi:hypothetical protein